MEAKKSHKIYICGTVPLELDPSNGGLIEFAMSPEMLSDKRECSDECGIREAELTLGKYVQPPALIRARMSLQDETDREDEAKHVEKILRAAVKAEAHDVVVAAVSRFFYSLKREKAKARKATRTGK